MQLRTLSIEGIGPFAGRHTIDLATLGAGGLFLLEGPTGAGKSTLIDAVVFALYGKVAAEGASDDRLRSDHAGPTDPSSVDLVFEVSSGVFRIRRTPQYERAKQRGSGTTTQQASVAVWRMPADTPTDATPEQLDALVGEAVAGRLDEAGLWVQDAIGLDRTQFVQTVVLPQGQFAGFLQAKPEDRRGLLQKIFGTQVYARLAERLVEMRRESERAVEASRGGLGEAVARFTEAARLDDDEAAALRAAMDGAVAVARSAAASGAARTGAAAASGAARTGAVATGGPVRVDAVAVDALLPPVRAALDAPTIGLVEAADRAREASTSAALVSGAARSALELATAQAAALARRDRLRAERTALEAAADEQADRVTRLARARAAAGVRGALDGAGAAATELDTVAKELDAALDIAPAGLVPKRLARAVAGAGTGAGAFGSGAGAVDAPDEGTGAATGALAALREHLEKQRRAAVQAAGAIERARRLEEGLVEQRKAARDLARHVDDLRTEVAGHTSWLDARPAERAELLTLRDAARSAVARLDGCRAAVERARDVLDAVRALATTGRELDAARGRCSVAAAAASAAVGEEAAARTRRLAGLAGELARALSDGDPCPVCGSDAHPLPAPLTPDHVSAEQVDAAAARREAAEKSVAALAATVAGLAERAEQLAARAGGLDESAASEALTCADAELAACAATAADEPRLTADLTGFDALTAERATTRAAVATDLATQEAALAVARAALDEAEAEVLTAREGFETVAARHSALVHRSEAADGLCQVLADRSEAADRLVVRRAELDLALTAAGFASDDDARAALLGPADVDRLDRQVSAHVADTARVAAALAEPELVDLPDDLRIDVRAAEQAERDARTAADGALTAAHAAEDRAAAARAAAGVVVDRAEAVAAALVSAAPISRMAALASGGGDNAAGLSLATFVLLRRFEDVVAAANERLTTMSDGRYELVRSDEKEDVRARNTGLAMRVVDHLTDTPRDPRTLSGGETFYVSLALALGMADVVRAESGGIELGTLFVDEGFGSLDPHVLDQVLTELGRLRAGGRVVGVVSHVEAMKQAIADRIEVRPLPGGASTLTVRAG